MFIYGGVIYTIILIISTVIVSKKIIKRNEKVLVKKVFKEVETQVYSGIYSSATEAITLSNKAQELLGVVKETIKVDEITNHLELRYIKKIREKSSATDNNNCFSMRLKLKTFYNKEIWLNANVRVNRSGNMTVLTMNFDDITDLVELETKNWIIEATLKSIVDNTKMISFIAFDTDWNVLLFNKRLSQKMERIFNYTLEKNQNMLELLSSEVFFGTNVLTCMGENIKKTLAGEKVQAIEQINRQNGPSVFMECEYSPIVIEENNVIGGMIFFRDVTKEFQVKEELLKEKEIEQNANAAKSKFLSNMGHEIRTPLNGVIGMTELLLNTSLTPKQYHLLNIVKTSGKSLLSIVNDVLDFSKIEAGEIEFLDEVINVHEAIDKIIDLFSYRCQEKGIRLKRTINEDVPEYIDIDPLRLNQILTNLVGNAIKFTESGYIGITVEKVESGLRFSVEDTGIGIPQEKSDHIFKSFKQGNEDTTKKYGGTGLGLAISKELIELMDGTIKVISKVGLGTIFYFTIPLKIPKSIDVGEKIKTTQFQVEDVKGMKILVAEDNEVNQLLMEELLQELKATVELASNGYEVIELLRDQEFDCILMDVSMPELDGIETTRIIRETHDELILPIIAVTAYASEEYKEILLDAGMNAYISKPVDAKTLSRVLGKYYKVDCESRVEMEKEGFDFSRVEEILKGNKSLVIELADKLVKGITQEIIPGISSAIEKADLEEALRLSHKVKGSVSNFGESSLLSCTVDLDRSLKEKDILLCNKLLNALRQEVKILESSLVEYKIKIG